MRILFLSLCLAVPALGGQPLKPLLEGAFRTAHPPDAKVEVRRSGGPRQVGDGATVQWFRPRPPVGAVGYEVTWSEKGQPKVFRGTAEVRVLLPVIVATRNLRNGQTLDRSMVRVEPREIQSHVGTGYFTDLSEVVGQEVRGWIRKGKVMGTSHVAPPTLVRSGQQVTLEQVRGALRVTARVQALQTGRLNDWIRVQNPRSRKTLRVRVAALGKVRLD